MLYVLYGDDYKKRGSKLRELTDFFLGKKPDTMLIKVSLETFSNYDLSALSLESGLFENVSVVVLDGLLSDKEIKESVFEKIKDLATSKNIFIINERVLGKGDLSALEKYAEKAQEFLGEAKPEKFSFNIFSLADAVGRRDKRSAWTLLLSAFQNGLEPEEIHGTIFWAVKNMLLVKNASRATSESTGLKPFVLTKAKNFSGNYSKEELSKFSSRMVALYHDSHRGIGDFSIGLEKLILETL